MNNENIDVTIQNFETEVVESSKEKIVITLFFSEKSAASKQLLPILEKAASTSNDLIKLTKINVETNMQIAQQMHVESIPTVFAFWNGQPVDGFAGAISEQQFSSWISKVIKTTGIEDNKNKEENFEKAIEQANDFINQGKIEIAKSIFDDLSEEFPNKSEIISGQINCMIKLGELDNAENIIKNLSKELSNDAKIIAVKTALDLAKETSNTDFDVEKAKAELKSNPKDHQLRFDFAMYLYGKEDTENALNELLEIVKQDRKWKNDHARVQMLKIFEALGFSHDHTIEARKKLSAILYS